MNVEHQIKGHSNPRLVSMSDFIDIIANIGTLDFSKRLLVALDQIVGADHCACYRLSDYRLTEIASAGQDGAALSSEAQSNVHDVKRHLVSAGDRVRIQVIRPVSGEEAFETVLVYARLKEASYCLKLLRATSHEALSDEDRSILEQAARFLLTIISRHSELFEQKSDLTPALASREDIEDCVENMSGLSRREREVCARILHGMSSCVIADDLGIGKESVMTYRKRAYGRLGIASQRELLMWYLDIWNDWVNSGKRARNAEQDAA